EAEAVGGGRRDAHGRALQSGRQRRLRLVAASGQPRPVPDYLDRHVADAIAGLVDQAKSLCEQNGSVRSCPSRIRGPELAAAVAEPRGGEQRVADRMSGDIAVRMTCQSLLTGPVQARQVKFPTVTERVHVNANANLRDDMRDVRLRILHPGTVPGVRSPGSRRVAFRPYPRSSFRRARAR